MLHLRTRLMAGISLTLVAGPALAQDAGLEEMTVSATRMPTSERALPNRITIVEREKLEGQLAISTSILDAVSSEVPSFAPTRQKLTGSGETMRGRDPLFMIDGVPQSNPLRDGSRDGFTLDPAVIERVEVLYGANAIQGIGGTGGVINYVTAQPREGQGLETRVEAGISSSDEFAGDGFSYRGAATVLNDFGTVDMVLSAAAESRGIYYDGDGRRVGIDTVQGDLQDSESLNLFGKFGVQIDERTRAQVMVNIFDVEGNGDYATVQGDLEAGIPTSAAKGTYPGEPTNNEVRTVSVDVTREALAGGRLAVQGFYQDFEAVFGGGVFDNFQDPAIDPSGMLFDQSANQSEKYGFKLAYSHQNLPVPGLSAVLGFDYLRDATTQILVQTQREWVPETKFKSWAPFLQVNQDLMQDRLHLSGGVRVENAKLDVDTYTTLAAYGPQTVDGGSPDFSELLWNAGASYDVTDMVTGYVSYAEGFTMADVGRVLRGVTTPGQDVDTLLDLEPVVADNYELGVKVNAGRFSLDAGYFWSHSDLGQRLVPDADGIFGVRREKTKVHGLEISGEFAATEAITLGAGYADLTGRFDSDDDGSVDSDLGGRNIGPDRLNAWIAWAPEGPFDARLQSSFNFDKDINDDIEFDGYTLVDARLGYAMARYGRIDLAVENVLDEQYITYYSQTASGGRTDRYFAGRGRTFTLRWSNTF